MESRRRIFPEQNPLGVWSYGWRAPAGGPLAVFTEHARPSYGVCDLDSWFHDVYEQVPGVVHNPHDQVIICGPYTPLVYPANSVTFHPGPEQQCVIRWTAPFDMLVTVSAEFTAIDIGSSLVHVYHNDADLFADMIIGVDDSAGYTATRHVQAGIRSNAPLIRSRSTTTAFGWRSCWKAVQWPWQGHRGVR
jgi:hypothetical protein